MQVQLPSQHLILTQFAKPPLLLWGPARPTAAHPTRLLQARERLRVTSFPASAAAWEELAQGVAAMHRQKPLPPMSFHHAFAPLAFLSHTWKSPERLEAGDSISCMAGTSMHGQGWFKLTSLCTAKRGPSPLSKLPACQRHKSSQENSAQQQFF